MKILCSFWCVCMAGVPAHIVHIFLLLVVRLFWSNGEFAINLLSL
jgi:hypothetical protein